MNKKILFLIIIYFSVNILLFSKGNGNDNNNSPTTNNPSLNTDSSKKQTNNTKSEISNFQKLKPEESFNIIKNEKNNNFNSQDRQNQFKEMNRNRNIITQHIELSKKESIELQKLCNQLQKNLKKNLTFSDSDFDNYNNLKDKYLTFINNLNLFKQAISEDDKRTLKNQFQNISKSNEQINKIFLELDIETKKQQKNIDNILKLNNSLANEINKIERQYRAIEWILFEE